MDINKKLELLNKIDRDLSAYEDNKKIHLTYKERYICNLSTDLTEYTLKDIAQNLISILELKLDYLYINPNVYGDIEVLIGKNDNYLNLRVYESIYYEDNGIRLRK